MNDCVSVVDTEMVTLHYSVFSVFPQGDRRGAVWGHCSQGVLQWGWCQVTHTHTHTARCSTAAIMNLSLLLVCIFLFHIWLSQGCDTAALSQRHLGVLFIKVINDIQPAVLIIYSVPYTTSFMLKYCLPGEKKRERERQCVGICVLVALATESVLFRGMMALGCRLVHL